MLDRTLLTAAGNAASTTLPVCLVTGDHRDHDAIRITARPLQARTCNEVT